MTHRELEQALAKLLSRVQQLEHAVNKPRTLSKAAGQPITLRRGIPADARTALDKPRYLPPYKRHVPLPDVYEGIVTNKPVSLKVIGKKLHLESWQIVKAYRAAGYTVIRDDKPYKRGKKEFHVLFVLPLPNTNKDEHPARGRRPKRRGAHR